MTDSSSPNSEQRAGTTSLGDLLSEVSRDVSTLMRQEVELAKAELRQSTSRAGKGAGLYAGAGVAGILTATFLSVALWWGLGYLVGLAWSGLIVGMLWAVIGVVLALAGKRETDAIRGLSKTVDTLKEIPNTLKRNEENR